MMITGGEEMENQHTELDARVDGDEAVAVAGTAPHCHTPEDGDRKSHHSDKFKANLMSRLNRIEGQIRGVKGMIERDTYCDDVLNQIAAVQSALNSVGKLLLEGHMRSCIVERIESGDHDVLDELLTTINKLVR